MSEPIEQNQSSAEAEQAVEQSPNLNENEFHDALDSAEDSPLNSVTAQPADQSATQAIESTTKLPPETRPHRDSVHNIVTDLRGRRISVEDPNKVLLQSLRIQIGDLSSQVTSLNAKLVTSFGRIGDLEDELDRTESNRRHLKARVDDLDVERKQWEERVEGGLLVEKAHVQTELTRMMDRVIEETASRGKAEKDKELFESELDELSASLFNEANKMVAVERKAKLTAEAKTASLEERLRDTEMVITQQAKQMNALGGQLEEAERDRDATQNMLQSFRNDPAQPSLAAPSNGPLRLNFASLPSGIASGPPSPGLFPLPAPFSLSHPLPPLLFDILPYHEFSLFVRHLARLRISTLSRPLELAPSSPHAALGLPYSPNVAASSPAASPAMQSGFSSQGSSYQEQQLHTLVNLSLHLAQPFLKRCVEEDSDPTLRLDLAPGLNWLSRRSVTTAVIEGHLAIEPLFGSLPSPSCTLCGSTVEIKNGEPASQTPSSSSASSTRAAAMRKLIDKGGSWASTFRSASGGALPTRSTSSSGKDAPQPHPEVFIFHTDIPGQTSARYTLCIQYCLPRLRAACEMWNYLRGTAKGIILDEVQKKYTGTTPMPMPVAPIPVTPKSLQTPSFLSQEDRASPEPLERVVSNESTGSKSRDELKHGDQEALEVPIDEKPTDAADSVQPSSPSEGPDVDHVDITRKSMESETGGEPARKATDEASASTQSTTSNELKPPLPKRSAARTPVAGQSANGSKVDSPNTKAALAVISKANADRSAPSNLPLNAVSSLRPQAPVRQASNFGPDPVAQQNWEQKTWHDIVRLKEAMYWSRMGARFNGSG